MTTDNKIYDVMVIGSGFAGMAAAAFAVKAGLNVVQTGATGGIDFSTGFIDLMGVHPMSEGKRWKNPWQAIEAMLKDHPKHPYGYLSAEEIRDLSICLPASSPRAGWSMSVTMTATSVH